MLPRKAVLASSTMTMTLKVVFATLYGHFLAIILSQAIQNTHVQIGEGDPYIRRIGGCDYRSQNAILWILTLYWQYKYLQTLEFDPK